MSLLARVCGIRGVFFGLDESRLDADPVAQFRRWFAFARRTGCPWPSPFCLSTATPAGRPAGRMILLKGADARGFAFYTHYVGRKASELQHTPFATMTFHWIELLRQVRIEGRVEKLSWVESNAYFQSRLRDSRIGAWASHQSEPLASRAEFDARFDEFKRKFAGGEVPLPPHWGGYRLIPDSMEFWQGRPNRLHDRFRYTPDGAGGWRIVRLNP